MVVQALIQSLGVEAGGGVVNYWLPLCASFSVLMDLDIDDCITLILAH